MATFYGAEGDNTFNGDEGNDIFYDNEGNDTYHTGGGDDTLYFTNITGHIELPGVIYVFSDYGVDTIYHEGTGKVIVNNTVDGTVEGYHTSITASEKAAESRRTPRLFPTVLEQKRPVKSSLNSVSNDLENFILTGNELDNRITGNAGNNILFGDKGDDNLIGLQGNDIILGAAGNDTLTGNTGTDTFVFLSPYDGSDSITDFNQEEGDKIQISSTGFDIELNDYSKFIFDTNSNQLFFELTPSDLLSIVNLQPEANFNPISDINIV